MKASAHLALLRDAGLSAKKSFGQNFLVADDVIGRIAAACVPEADVGRARVVELGAGTGALTAALVARAAHVTAVERDRELVPLLSLALPDALASGAVSIIEADAQTIDVARAYDGEPGLRVLAGNLPYQITGQLLRLAIAHADVVDRVVFMVQAEVADRLVASPSTKAYGALSVFVQAAFEVTRLFDVPAGAFVPPPSIESSVVLLRPRRPPLARETDTFRALVKAAFGARRKTLRNAWRALGDVAAAAAASDVSLDARGETLDVLAFARVAAALDAR